MSQLVSKWNYPTTVRFGAGRIAELPEVLEAAGIRKPLFVTDPGLAKLPIVADTLAVLDRAGVPYGLFSDVKPNPVHSNLVAGVEAYRAGGHDGVIAFGGGSALDLGKLVAFQQAVQHAPGECAMRAAALQGQVDLFGHRALHSRCSAA
mgnify:CR=1 FL=1